MRRALILFFITPFVIHGQDQPTAKMSVEQYIEKYASLAVEEMYRSHIPASITLAQGLLESGNGNSRLANEANNHFGIKCKNSWTGKTIFEDDDAPQECFRKYDAVIDSYRDHSDFLMSSMRYAFLFDLEPSDYKGWASGLKRAGYATNPQYPDLIISFIEKHDLQRFDKVKLSEEEDRQVKESKVEELKNYGKEFAVYGIPAIIAPPGEGYAKVALDHDIKVWQLYKYNDLPKDAFYRAGDTLFLKSKRNKADEEYHIVKGRETMHQISQRYALKLEKLLDRNLMLAGQEPVKGERIYLHSKREKLPMLRDLSDVKVELRRDLGDTTKMDTLFNAKVYDTPARNLETMKPVDKTLLPDSFDARKENLSFFHTVQKGETLYGISKKYNVRVDAIKYINALQSDTIALGSRLIINPNIPVADTHEPQPVPGFHKVREGETLFSIAKTYAIKLADLKAQNNLQGDTVQIGQQLVIVPVIKGAE